MQGNALSRSASVKKSSRLKQDEDGAEDGIPAGPSSIHVLRSSLPQADDEGITRSMHPRNPLSRGLQSMTASDTPARSPGPKKTKPRWHFGIRSRSPPLEVMLEIYKTLQTLGFEWKQKEDPPDVGLNIEGLSDEDPKKRRRREEEERVKTAQGLFYVEARCRMDDVMVCNLATSL